MTDHVIGTATFTKSIDEGGAIVVGVEYDGLTSYEVIGMLTVELDTQRADMQQTRP